MKENFYKDILNSMTDMVAVKDKESKIVWANQSFLDFHGISEAEVSEITTERLSLMDVNLYVKHCPASFEDSHSQYMVCIWSEISDNAEYQPKQNVNNFNQFYQSFISIVNSFPIPALMLNPKLECVSFSQSWGDSFGPNQAEKFDFAYPQLAHLDNELLAIMKKNKENYKEIFAWQDNKFSLQVSPWTYPDCSIGGFLLVLVDISESKINSLLYDKSTELKVLSNRLNLALQVSQTCVWEWNMETQELIWDKGMYDLYGITEDDFTSSYVFWEQSLHPDDKVQAVKDITEAVNKEERFNSSFRIVTPTGEIRHIRALADFERNEYGKCIKMVGVNWDKTQFFDMEEKIDIMSSKLVALDEITDGWWDWNLKTNEEYLSPRFKSMFGYSEDEMESSVDAWQSIIDEEDLKKVNENFQQHLETDSKFPFRQTVKYKHKSGKPIHVICRGKAIKDRNGEFTRMIGTHTDVTLQHEQALELLKSNDELDQFAYIASHDLREPLRGMRSYAKILIEEYSEMIDEDGQHYLDRIDTLGKRLEEFLDALLFYSRLGREEDAYQLTDIKMLIEQCLSLYISPEKSEKIQVILPENLPSLNCQPLQIQKIIANLLGNAIRYNDKETIVIEVTYQKNTNNNEHQFFIKDNGIGIDSIHFDRVFKLFKRLHGRNDYEGGVGIGLTIAQKAAQLHGGNLWVEDSTPGKGTTFTFTFMEKKMYVK